MWKPTQASQFSEIRPLSVRVVSKPPKHAHGSRLDASGVGVKMEVIVVISSGLRLLADRYNDVNCIRDVHLVTEPFGTQLVAHGVYCAYTVPVSFRERLKGSLECIG